MKKAMDRITKTFLVIVLLGTTASCDGVLDVVPDNVATVDQSFDTRENARQYLFTLYSYMPPYTNTGRWTYRENPGMTTTDAFWASPPWEDNVNGMQILKGNQTVVEPYTNYWEGRNGGTDLYEAIRQCNILIENIGQVPDMPDSEKARWTAEAKFLKAFYHFYLLRMYGPIVVVEENLPVSASEEEAARPRTSVDSTFSYIFDLVDEAVPDLPARVSERTTELGRITKTIALGMKAKMAVTAASPLFNGNQNYQGWRNPNGEQLFDVEENNGAEWERALEATTEAVEMAEQEGFQLYKFDADASEGGISDTTIQKMTIRNSVAAAETNSEAIWYSTNNFSGLLQDMATPRGLDSTLQENNGPKGILNPPIRIAEMFYTENGLPLQSDRTWDYADRREVKIVPEEEKNYLEPGYETIKLHFDREPRFYANLGFDGGVWYGQGRYDGENPFFVTSRKGDPVGGGNINYTGVTGYWPKKLVNYESVIIGEGTTFQKRTYPWPLLRLADLYLLHAEALNEVNGPTAEAYEYLNKVRERAGIPTVQDAWSNFSNRPDKYTTQPGLREIIHKERLIELANEGHRTWDLRRWKEAIAPFNEPIQGWTLTGASAEEYYRPRTLSRLSFSGQDYLWPISEQVLISNQNIAQNPGW
jgi:hypothetical protein